MQQTLTRQRISLSVLGGLVALGGGLHLFHLVTAGAKPDLLASSVIFALMCLGHATYLLGWKRAITFFTLTAVMSYCFESLSIATCSATCYTYTNALGPMLGPVPAAIPISWFMMLYPSTVIANLIGEGKAISTKGKGVWMVFLAVLTSLVMTAWDLTLDPYMVYKVKAWVWTDPLPYNYLGIPFANYVGWVEVVFIISLVYRLAEREIPAEPLGPPTQLMVALPLISYAIIGLPDVLIGVPDATRILSPYAMGIPLLAAISRYIQMPRDHTPAPVTVGGAS